MGHAFSRPDFSSRDGIGTEPSAFPLRSVGFQTRRYGAEKLRSLVLTCLPGKLGLAGRRHPGVALQATPCALIRSSLILFAEKVFFPLATTKCVPLEGPIQRIEGG